MRRGWFLALLLAAAGLGGCGGQSDEEKAHERRDRAIAAWDNREGSEWRAYERAWSAGWSNGCSAIEGKLEPERSAGSPSDCANPPGPDNDVVYDPPFYPPNSPQEQGREDGFERGCEDQYEREREKPAPPDFCLALTLEWNREQRVIDAFCAQAKKERTRSFLCPATP